MAMERDSSHSWSFNKQGVLQWQKRKYREIGRRYKVFSVPTSLLLIEEGIIGEHTPHYGFPKNAHSLLKSRK